MQFKDLFRKTGALFGGGSEGIHQMMKNITGTFETFKAYVDMRKAQFEKREENPKTWAGGPVRAGLLDSPAFLAILAR